MNITIIGSGNVATVLATMLKKAGHSITQLKGRDPLHNLNQTSDLYIAAIADNALPDLKDRLSLTNRLIVHTAGSVSKHVLKSVSSNYGVLYPLQSIRKGLNIPSVPFLIDANTEENKQKLVQLAATISNNVQYAGDEQRAKLHLAAVITNNFTNHLFTLTEEYCREEHVDFKLLFPLLNETVNRLSFSSAKDSQTGPAQRNDVITIQKQREMLQSHPSLLKIYNLFTESIISLRSS